MEDCYKSHKTSMVNPAINEHFNKAIKKKKKQFTTRIQTHCIDHHSQHCQTIRILLKHIRNAYCSNAASDI